MKLLDDFYRIEQLSVTGTELEYLISLNREHFIYRAHFPGNPITPGACIIQLCRELMELRTGKPLLLKKIVNVKFLSAINPVVDETVRVIFSKATAAENGYRFSAVVCSEAKQFAKLSLVATAADDDDDDDDDAGHSK
ncbi:MAG: 3-hydroxyacyl-ACP dehydratase [Prevotellaceae bacterium]|jgi:3-hydroxyacyl-[acyl-carrier-protein] dehydratase|nr:3-hydroxyacyl-ACP dehydratase [Prevotellaceae bacterium]